AAEPDAAEIDAGPVPDTSAVVPDQPTVEPADRSGVLAATDAVIRADNRAALDRAGEELSAALAALPAADSGDPATDPAVMITRARIHTALAQHLLDRAAAAEAAGADKAERNKLERQAKQRVLDALTLAKKALKQSADDTASLVVMADVARLQGKRARDVERYLKRALRQKADNRDALLVRALLDVRDDRLRQARAALTELAASAGDLSAGGDARPLYRLALLDEADKAYEDARRRADELAGAVPGHSGAAALIARITEATAVDTSDPLPPQEDGTEGGDDSGGDKDEGSGSKGGDSFDALVERAHRKAENGSCSEAMALYERALDINPTSVSALTGMGYCHVDSRQFSSAHDKFKAALAVSPRYQDALWGIAEAYQQQGLKAQAIAAFQRFLDEHPTSSRAAGARRQIERLGGSVASPSGEGADSDGADGADSGGGDSGDGADDGAGGDGADDGADGGGAAADKPAATETPVGASGDSAGTAAGDGDENPGSASDPAPAPKPPAAADPPDTPDDSPAQGETESER
ncbi:MAG: tetratricopeptide repeat protein, partial [Myxococcota bacterium]